jgi:hypothetical protein
MVEPEKSYGLLAEFESEQQLLEAAHRVHGEGYRHTDAFSPFPVKGIYEALGHHGTAIPMIVFCGGAFLGLGGFFMEWFASVIDYPLNIGGRPLNSWPAFIPITFELTVLGASLAALAGMILLNKLPCPYHAVFNAPQFERASLDRFFICIESSDPKFDLEKTKQFLLNLKPLSVSGVAP